MKALIDPNRRLNRVAGKVVDLFFLNVLFLVTCLPVLTIGTSLLSLASVTMKLVDDQVTSPTASFLTAFKDNLKQGTLLTLLFGGLYAMLFTSFVLNQQLFVGGNLVVLCGIGILLMIVFITGLYCFQYCGRYQDTLFHSLAVSFQIACLNIKTTGILVVSILGYFYLYLASDISAALAGLVTIMFGLAGGSYWFSYQLKPIFQQYEVEVSK